MAQELARIERVDIREVWPYEAANFTPWLAEHLSELGEALGLDLELLSREAPVGGFSLDILARDVVRGYPVVIENQLEATDHTHLGQLLTYAAGYDANVVVWIAREFSDEHREALDLLNRRTDEKSEFFGVVVEVWKIGDSRPAPHFRVVSAPNDWRKQNVRPALTGKGERYRKFFQALVDVLRENHRFTDGRKGSPQLSSRHWIDLNWCFFHSGYGGVGYNLSFPRGNKARVELYVGTGDKAFNKHLFDSLKEAREGIESEIEGSLEWERLDDQKDSRISAVRQGSIYDPPETLEEIRGWMVERLLAFKQTFGPRLDESIRIAEHRAEEGSHAASGDDDPS